MCGNVRRAFVEKRLGYDVEAVHLYNDFKENLSIDGLESVRVINRYDMSNISDKDYMEAVNTILSESTIDNVYYENIDIDNSDKVFAVEYLPGQYDQRADWAAQCVQILTQGPVPKVHVAKVIVLKGNISEGEFGKIKSYYINPVDSKEALLDKPDTLDFQYDIPEDVDIVEGFTEMDMDKLMGLIDVFGFAMDIEDLKFCQRYFKDEENREPFITELKVIDTYWSDHCRHTTFQTNIDKIIFEDGEYNEVIRKAYNEYLESRKYLYQDRKKDVCLMDLATIAMKELRKKGKLDDLEVSDEINAASIMVDVDVNGEYQKWLIMFKNETHNHPTEIEPFGGAATCLGGAIRDPLSGRSYVYQAMRVTGSGDPRTPIEETLSGKLPQRRITIDAAKGYSSYGNQIGLATGQVAEIYHNDYIAKRMEIGAVIAAAPKENVVREKPQKGDIILLVGGRTGRDGCGGATGSSKEHTEESIYTCGAEVQKGNPPTERKIQRLFRNSNLSRLIKKCNDFGAGGVSVAIGELADSLEIDLDKVTKKYEGLDGTELAISESQERMAVVIDNDDLEEFTKYCKEENLESTVVAKVTDNNRLKMNWRGNTILDISRTFLDTNGITQHTTAVVTEPSRENYMDRLPEHINSKDNIGKQWMDNLKHLNVACQKGLVERFDSSIGAGSVLMPFGGKYQLTPTDGMVAKVPMTIGETNTCTIMTYGFDPNLSKWSPFHGGLYAVIHSIAKIVALGGDYKGIRLTLQEYFEKLGKDPKKWGKPLSALLGAFYAQKNLEIPAIGGKDSMSGTFNDLHVPPTLVSFAVNVSDARNIVSPEFKEYHSKVILIPVSVDDYGMVDFKKLTKGYERIYKLISEKRILSAYTVGFGGMAAALSKMSFGNKIGMKFIENIEDVDLFNPHYGAIILEVKGEDNLNEMLQGVEYRVLGDTIVDAVIEINREKIDLNSAIDNWIEPLNDIFPIEEENKTDVEEANLVSTRKNIKSSSNIKIAKPRVFVPVFPGTNCEYDTARAFERAGGIPETFVFKNLSSKDIQYSIEEMVKGIRNSQIIAIPGGFSAGDEPDGSGKFIATVFRNPRIREEIMEFIKNRDGLMLGICNGFQALIKLGLVPFGEIVDLDKDCPTLTFNNIGRHVSTMVQTKITSNLSPWFNNTKVGDIHTIAVSHGEGRFVANEDMLKKLRDNGQIATQYVEGSNPNGSVYGIEGITSPDGRILGKMAHSERIGRDIAKNVPGNKDQRIFEAGVRYFY
ncbi:phosphoribosylformylglycinamidine synthase [Clostridiisalibacter paucivorans]|uniref:phosphoribosylformylglycinamidine synthase n=1 Tax=Clostridiisalibacter paucivorans TaxID=408753 RepID=UPI00047A4FE9|nr:phosphoribosylformylglycinamidine synthase [Clostridiisalibacter paucivorans]